MKPYRKFLTRQGLADSYIAVESSYGSATLKIADCDRAVQLNFSFDKIKRAKFSLKKLAVLQEGLDLIKKELEGNLDKDRDPQDRGI